MKNLGGKSVIQGSKMASIHNNIYTLEMGKIEEVIKNENLYKLITGRAKVDNHDTTHEAIGYVDDLSQIMANENLLVL